MPSGALAAEASVTLAISVWSVTMQKPPWSVTLMQVSLVRDTSHFSLVRDTNGSGPKIIARRYTVAEVHLP